MVTEKKYRVKWVVYATTAKKKEMQGGEEMILATSKAEAIRKAKAKLSVWERGESKKGKVVLTAIPTLSTKGLRSVKKPVRSDSVGKKKYPLTRQGYYAHKRDMLEKLKTTTSPSGIERLCGEFYKNFESVLAPTYCRKCKGCALGGMVTSLKS